MNIPVNVNVTSDICSGVGCHLFSPPGQPFCTVPAPGTEVPTHMDWAPGKSKGAHSFTSSVKHRASNIVLAGHDCGWLIQDEAFFLSPYVNGHLGLMMLRASRAVSYTASTVKMNGKETGLVSWTTDCPILSCGEPVPTPLVKSDTSFNNTVIVGATEADMLVGKFTIIAKMWVAWVEFVISIVSGLATPAEALEDLALEDVMGNLTSGLLPTNPSIKDLVGLAASGAISAFASYESGWTKPVTVVFAKNSATGGYSSAVTYDPTTHQVSATDTVMILDTKRTSTISSGPNGPTVTDNKIDFSQSPDGKFK